MGYITPADNRGRAKIPPPSPRKAIKNRQHFKTKSSSLRDLLILPILISMALFVTVVSPEPLPQTPIDPSVTSKNLCSLVWCNCTRINEVPSAAEVPAASYGRRGYSYVDSIRPVVVKDGLKVACSCAPGQELSLDHNSLPQETLVLEVSGCSEVKFKAGSLSRSASLAVLHLRSSGRVFFKRNLYIPPPHLSISSASLHYPSRDHSYQHRTSPHARVTNSTRAPIFGRYQRSARPSPGPRVQPRGGGGAASLPYEVRLDVSHCQSVSLESGAFRTGAVVGGGVTPLSQGTSDTAANIAAVRPRPPLSVRLHRVDHVLVDTTPFVRLSTFHASDVPRLVLKEYAFSVEPTPAIMDILDGIQKNGVTTTHVNLRNVTIPWVPGHAFPSSTTEVKIEESQMNALRRDAFSAIIFSGISILNSKIGEVESGAFSGRTLCLRLALHHVTIQKLSHVAIHSAVNGFSFTNSWVTQVSGGAFNFTVASANITDNVFEMVRSRGFALRDWDRVRLHNNTFLRLETGSLSSLLRPYWVPYPDASEDFSTSSSSSPLLQVYSRLNDDDMENLKSIQRAQLTIAAALNHSRPPEHVDDLYPGATTFRRFKRFTPRPRELNITDNVFGETPTGALSLLPAPAGSSAALSSSQEEEDGHDRPVAMVVSENRFRSRCRCTMIKWLRGLTGEKDDAVVDVPSPRQWSRALYNTSMCLVDSYLARCFNVSMGFMRMRDFALLVCPADDAGGADGDIQAVCDPEEENPAVHKAVVVVVPDTAAGAGGVGVTDLDLDDAGNTETEMERDKKILNTIFVAVVICICIIVTVTWVGRSNWWKRMRERRQMTAVEEEEAEGCWTWMVFARISSGLAFSRRANGMAVGGKGRGSVDEDGTSGADSITRLSVEGYNEMKERENGGTGSKKGTRGRPEEAEGNGLLEREEEDSDEEEDVEKEDKATQTMPEELTQELLVALREKLDDPENYSEARDMIEHLYDMIKVEEEREQEEQNRRDAARRAMSVGTTDDEEDDSEEDDDNRDEREENLYDVIMPPNRESSSGCERKVGKRPKGRHREVRSYNSVGTRAPSPDKLEPVLTASASMASLASIASLVSPLGSPMPKRGSQRGPRRRRPAPKAPAVCEYVEPKDRAQHVYTELPVNGVGSNCDPRPPRLRIKDEQVVVGRDEEQGTQQQPPPPPPNAPFKFLRALGETFLTPNKPPRVPIPSSSAQKPPDNRGKSNGGIVCEYTEPTDARVHVYTELPPTTGQSSSSPGHSQLPISMANRPLPHKPDSPDSPKPSTSFALR